MGGELSQEKNTKVTCYLIDFDEEGKRISQRREKWRINLRVINMDEVF